MVSFPSPEQTVKIPFFVDDLLLRARRLESLREKAGSSDERRNWTRDLRRVRRELRELAPVRQCANRRPAPTRQARRAGTRRSARSPHRNRGGTPPPSGGSDNDDPDPDPAEKSDDTAVAAMCRILGFVMCGDRLVADGIVDRIRHAGPEREKGIMQVALSIWLAQVNRIAVDVRDVFETLGVDHINASEYPTICIALNVEFVADGPAIDGPQHADRLLPTTAVLS